MMMAPVSVGLTCHSGAGQNMIDWSPFEDPCGLMPVLCPLCGGFGEQQCFNCGGEGVVTPLALPPWVSES